MFIRCAQTTTLLICHVRPHRNSQVPGRFGKHCTPRCYGSLCSGVVPLVSPRDRVPATHRPCQSRGTLQHFHVPSQHCGTTLPRPSSASPVLRSSPLPGGDGSTDTRHTGKMRGRPGERNTSFGKEVKKASKSIFVLTEHSKSQEELFPNTFISIKARA